MLEPPDVEYMPEHEVIVYSTQSCPHCKNLKAFLDRHAVSYTTIDVGSDVHAAREMIDLTGQRSVPVIVIDGQVIIGYDPDTVSALLDLTIAEISGDHELIILGSGAAGLAAAMYAGRKGLETLVIGAAPGGMIARSEIVENYPGFYQISGEALMNLFSDQSQSYGAVLFEDVVTGVQKTDEKFLVTTLSGREFTAKAVIIAVGRTPNLSGVPGESEFFGKGISVCTTCDGPLYAGKRVGIYGGGATAVDMALEMSGIASEVYLISRSPLKADAVLIHRLEEKSNVEILTGFVLTQITGEDQLSAITIAPRDRPENPEIIALDGLFLGIGLRPNTAVFTGLVAMNDSAEIIVDENCRTDVPGIFAAGDATSIEGKQVAVAVGEGVKALLSAYAYLKS